MNVNQVAGVAALLGEPARAAMLMALMDGRALTARELAEAAGIQASTASRHLALLVEGGLLALERQGRHRYHRLASPEVARAVESLMQLGAPPRRAVVTGPRDAALRAARTCYDHLAGRLGVAIADRLQAAGAVALDAGDDEGTGRLTDAGRALLARAGLVLEGPVACRLCLDWSERRSHLAGALGRQLCAHGLAQGWLRPREGSRALAVTPRGVAVLRETLGVAVD